MALLCGLGQVTFRLWVSLPSQSENNRIEFLAAGAFLRFRFSLFPPAALPSGCFCFSADTGLNNKRGQSKGRMSLDSPLPSNPLAPRTLRPAGRA